MNTSKTIKNSGWWIIIFLSLLPIILNFYNFSLTIKSLGDIAGLVGMAMFALVIILSARLKVFEKFFNGINQVYIAHHILGGLTFCLLLFHPLLLAYNYFLISTQSAALFLLPGSSLAQNLGIFGLFVMIITLVITFYMKIKYQIWKFTHKFMGIAFILAFFHTMLIGADVSSNQFLRGYLFLLGISAILAYLYRAVLGRYLVKNFCYIVKNITTMPDSMYEIELIPTGEKMPFSPGQFAFLKFYNKALSKEAHPFSMSSAQDNPLKFIIKELGDYTKKVSSLKAGDKVKLEGAFGAFNFRNYENKNQIWIAGGVGVTPFLSMLRSIDQNDQQYKIDLYYCTRDEKSLAFVEEIKKISDENENFNVIFWETDKLGFITTKAVIDKTENAQQCDFFVCGPTSMMTSIKKQLQESGVKENKVHMEELQLY